MVYSGSMSKKPQKHTSEKTEKEPQRKTPTFMLELALRVNRGQAKCIRAHLEAGRALYNAVLSEGQRRLRRMRADPAWQAARAIPRTHTQERATVRQVRGMASTRDVGRALETRPLPRTGDTLLELPTRRAKLSQFCHGCGKYVKKPLSLRFHHCSCGVGPVQRDLYAAFLEAFLDPDHLLPSCAQYVVPWEGAEARLRAAHERVIQRANEGQNLPRSFGIPRAGARQPESRSEPTQEPAFSLRRGRLEAWKERENPRAFMPGSFQL